MEKRASGMIFIRASWSDRLYRRAGDLVVGTGPWWEGNRRIQTEQSCPGQRLWNVRSTASSELWRQPVGPVDGGHAPIRMTKSCPLREASADCAGENSGFAGILCASVK